MVYTPNEVVDFIIRGADFLLEKHFGKTLADENVQILDPATGTGTFVTNLINHLPLERLEHKYRHEIHANEVAILPYYIANLNIEYTYQQRTGRYVEFPNLCFVGHAGQPGLAGAGGDRGSGDASGVVQPGGPVGGELDQNPGAEREADQRDHRQPAVQRHTSRLLRTTSIKNRPYPDDRPAHPGNLHRKASTAP